MHIQIFRFTFVNANKSHDKFYLIGKNGMKDRIRKIMESQHMSQHNFAQFIGISTAALSSIFNGRTKPTLNTVEAIRNKLPGISLEWLVFGTGDMYNNSTDPQNVTTVANTPDQEPTLDFDLAATALPDGGNEAPVSQGVERTLKKSPKNDVKIINKPARRITEIRVFYDDQTYESFSPR